MSVNRNRIAGGLIAASVAGAGLVAPIGASAASAAPSARTAPAVMCCGRGVDLGARLNPSAPFPRAHGWAHYESHPGWREFEVQVCNMRSLAGKRVTVRVHGTILGTMRVGPWGGAHMFRRGGLPSMGAGDIVRVRTGFGKIVVAGQFHATTT